MIIGYFTILFLERIAFPGGGHGHSHGGGLAAPAHDPHADQDRRVQAECERSLCADVERVCALQGDGELTAGAQSQAQTVDRCGFDRGRRRGQRRAALCARAEAWQTGRAQKLFPLHNCSHRTRLERTPRLATASAHTQTIITAAAKSRVPRMTTRRCWTRTRTKRRTAAHRSYSSSCSPCTELLKV